MAIFNNNTAKNEKAVQSQGILNIIGQGDSDYGRFGF